MSQTSLEVSFSEDMVKAEAITSTNYVLSGGINVIGVNETGGSSRTFILLTSTMAYGTSYTLTASNIHSIAGALI